MRAVLFSSLRFRVLLLLAMAVAPVFAILVYTSHEARESEARHTRDVALRLAHLVVMQQRDYVAGARQLLPTLAQLPAVRRPVDGAACNRALADLLERYPYYANFGLIGVGGLTLCSGLPFDGPVDLADRSYFRRALDSGGFAVGDYQIGRITGISSINFGYPVTDGGGRPTGVVFAALDLAWLSRQLDGVPLPEGTTVTIFEKAGVVLARYPETEGWIGRSVRDEPVTRLILEHGDTGTAEPVGEAGVPRLYAFTPLLHGDEDSRAYVSVGIPQNVAYGELDRTFKRNLAIVLLAVLIVAGIAWAGSTLLVLRPLNVLGRAAERLGHGDLAARTGLSPAPGEIGRLAQTFDRMAESVQQRQSEIETRDRKLHRINRALQTLSGGNRALIRAEDEPWLLREMCRVAVELGGYLSAWVGYAEDDAGKTVRPVAEAGIERAVLEELRISWADTELGRGPTGTAVRTGQISVVRGGLQTDPQYRAWHDTARERGINAAVSLPLHVGGTVPGALTIYAEDPEAFGPREIDILTEMGGDLAYGIDNLRARTRQKEAEDTIHRMAYYDALTGLPNHVSMHEALERSVAAAQSTGQSVALLFFDLDRLRDINESLGFEAGNAVMKEAGRRLRQAFGQNEFIARLRGDEFAAVLPGVDAGQARRTAIRILDVVEEPFGLAELAVDVTASAGIVLYPEHGDTVGQLLRHADVAAQLAKNSGDRYAFYSRERDPAKDKKRRLALAGDLRRALEQGGLMLHYQPKVDMGSGRVCGFEALSRWPHPEHGMVPPDEFIGLAERTGLIQRLSDRVLETALRQSQAWRQNGIGLPMAVNLSARNLQDRRLLDKIESLYSTLYAGEGMLELEITESAIMDDPAGALEILTRLRELGIALYIDDFGTGYSSLGYLKKLPVDAVKIDKSFVMDMLHDADSATIVRSTITLAHDLELKVVAEGVEDEAIWNRLVELGCDTAQGYYMARPMPAEQVDGWLEASCWGIAVSGENRGPEKSRPHKEGG